MNLPNFLYRFLRVFKKTPSVILPFVEYLGPESTLSVNAIYDSRVITLNDASSFNVSDSIELRSGDGFIMHSIIKSKSGNDLTLNILVDGKKDSTTYLANVATAKVINSGLNVTGSDSSPKIFKAEVDKDTEFHRMMLTMITDNPIKYDGFGDGNELLNGLLFRKVSSEESRNTETIFKNWDFAQLSYDLDTFAQTNPQGVNGLSMRFTIEKLGTVSKLSKGESLEVMVQDDLNPANAGTTNRNIIKFNISVQGSETF